MESTNIPRQYALIITDCERRLQILQTTPDDQILNQFESLVNDCTEHLQSLQSSSDPNYVAFLSPNVLRTIIGLSKISLDQMNTEKSTQLMASAKTLHLRVKEFLKSGPVSVLLCKSTAQRYSCDQFHLICESINNTDLLTTLICYKLIVKVLTGAPDEQCSQTSFVKPSNIDNGFRLVIYRSILQQVETIGSKIGVDNAREATMLKMLGVYFQCLQKLLRSPDLICEMEHYRDFFQTLFQLHQCVELANEQNRFQMEFFINTVHLQEVLGEFLRSESSQFFADFFSELSSNRSSYVSLIVLFRLIDAMAPTMSAEHLQSLSRCISSLYELIDQCPIRLIFTVFVPSSFEKSPVELQNIEHVAFGQLLKLVRHQPMETILSSMTHLIRRSNDSIVSPSIRLACEFLIQSYFLYYSTSKQVEDFYSLFLAELLRRDVHRSLIDYFFTLSSPMNKCRIYQFYLSSNRFEHFHQLFESKDIQTLINNPSTIFPNRLDHLYGFVRLFRTQLNPAQIQHAFDTCFYAIQQFISLPILSQSNCNDFLLILRLFAHLNLPVHHEQYRSLLGQLTQLFTLLDETTAMDLRLEFLRLFSSHRNHLDDNDLGRLLDFLLQSSIDSTPSSMAFHLTCLQLLDSLRQRSSRSPQITDLIIQSIVRYGNEQQQCTRLFKAQLMRVFFNYINHGNENALVTRVKSQCATLRADVEKFEKKTKTDHAPIPWQNLGQFVTSKTPLNDEHENQLKFYRNLVAELESLSLSNDHSQSMQED